MRRRSLESRCNRVKFLSVELAPYVARYSFEYNPNAVASRFVYRKYVIHHWMEVLMGDSFALNLLFFFFFYFFWKENV